jgi:hypothetical protein
MKDEIAGTIYAKEYTDWHIKTGGFARDMTLRDHFAGQAMDKCPLNNHTDAAAWCYARADSMLKERTK